jgi:hypothetical protein
LFRKHVTVASQQLVVRHWSHGPCVAVPPSGGVSKVKGSESMLHVPPASTVPATDEGPDGVPLLVVVVPPLELPLLELATCPPSASPTPPELDPLPPPSP